VHHFRELLCSTAVRDKEFFLKVCARLRRLKAGITVDCVEGGFTLDLEAAFLNDRHGLSSIYSQLVMRHERRITKERKGMRVEDKLEEARARVVARLAELEVPIPVRSETL
jgi:hypothetical protein